MTTLPPHNLEAEEALLGSLLIDRDAIAAVADDLTPEAFFHHPNGRIYKAMLWLWQQRRPCDPVTLMDALEQYRVLDQVGGRAYVARLMESAPTAVHAPHYAAIVNGYAARRAGIDACSDVVKRAYAGDVDWDEAAVEIRRSPEPFTAQSTNPAPLAERVDAFVDLTLRRWDGEIVESVVTTGIESLDRMLSGGMRAQELMVIGARPSMGKTALMLHMARRTRSLVFSLEMPERQVLNRLISAEAGVGFDVAMQHVGDAEHRDRWLKASERVASWPVTIVDTPGMTTARIEAMVERQMGTQPVDAVYIDHLGYLADQFRYTNEQEKTGELIRRCKLLARRCSVPVVVLSQLNRDVESRQSCVPYMSDIRSSGRVEEDADVVGLLFRRRYYVEKGMVSEKPEEDWITATDWERVVINVAKNRNGPVGSVEMGWEAAAMRFHDPRERRAA